MTTPTLVPDGIICPEKFAKACPKILWILKETNGCADLRAYLNYSVTDYRNWARTWAKVALLSYSLLTRQDFSKARQIVSAPQLHLRPLHDPQRQAVDEIMRQIAVMNIKKTAGLASAKFPEIKAAYRQHATALWQQAAAVKPDIIFVACGEWQFRDEVADDLNAYFARLNLPRPAFVSLPHPNDRRTSRETYFELAQKQLARQSFQLR